MKHHKQFIISTFCSLLLLLSNDTSAQQWPSITITRDNLALQSRITTVSISHDPVYKSGKKYQAFPLQSIIKKLGKNYPADLDQAVIVFTATDGYKVSMAYPDALEEHGYLAFKDLSAQNTDWTAFKFGKELITPAPFYLVWPKPGIDKWRYPWPFQLTNISIQAAGNYFGNAAPVSAKKSVVEGFTLFSRYCIRCHSVNSSGGSVGPELNVPQNVTELYDDKTLKELILNASAYRNKTKMPVFNNILNEQQVNSILSYFKSMKIDKINTNESR